VTAELRYLKGHATENTFLLIPDLEGRWNLTPDVVAALCHRSAGLGADGLLRVLPTALDETVKAFAAEAPWFMDYRNADGSLAEMCGNGARLVAHYLVRAGLADAGEVPLATRAGLRRATVPTSGPITVEMGPATLGPSSLASLMDRSLAGTVASVGNPHLVCLVETPVADLDLTRAPGLDPAVFPEGANLEVVNVTESNRIRMRVYERGVGETRSCGTGACAAAAVVLAETGPGVGTVAVEVPGGEVIVTVTEDTCSLAGPATLVGEGVVDPAWLAAVTSHAELRR
jgi:diaminopimelate epimerase